MVKVMQKLAIPTFQQEAANSTKKLQILQYCHGMGTVNAVRLNNASD